MEYKRLARWDLSSLFPDRDSWEAQFSAIGERLERLRKSNGTFLDSVAALVETIQLIEEIESSTEALYIYTYLQHLENEEGSEMLEKADHFLDNVNSSLLEEFAQLHAIDEALLDHLCKTDSSLNVYRQYLTRIRKEESMRRLQQESAIEELDNPFESPFYVYEKLLTDELIFDSVIDERGREVEANDSTYLQLLMSHDSELRRNTFYSVQRAYGRVAPMLVVNLQSHVRKSLLDGLRISERSVLENRLVEEGLTIADYENLIRVVEAHVPLLHRLHEIRKNRLGVDELHWYDLYHSLVPGYSFSVEYKLAQHMVRDALSVLGEEYQDVIESAFQEGWIDVYPRKGKMPGAFAVGVYKAHPYVALNYSGSLDDVFALVHELGHAAHLKLTQKHQPFCYASPSFLISEIVALVNEHLLMEYLITTSESSEMRDFLINFSLEQYRGKVFRQTLNSEFERTLYETIQSGQALDHEALGHRYTRFLGDYYGPSLVIGVDLRNEWLRIRHLYKNFYFYNYPLGFLLAGTIAKRILEGQNEMRAKFLIVLKKGNSIELSELLQLLDLDLHDETTLDDAFLGMKRWL